jgi:peptidoglycan/LPS O-acetylase OafA/YrhL
VILHHLTGPGQSLEPLARALPFGLFELVRGGYMAVTTFFTLSGFVLARSYYQTDWTGRNIWRYASGRVARIYPVYLLSMLIVAPFILADHTPGKGWYAAAHGVMVQGWLGTLPVSWNTPAWSLSCEMFFYLAFPLAVFLFRKPTWTKTLVAAAVAVCLTRWMWAAGVSDGVKPLVHLSDFLMGIAAACAYDMVRRSPRRPEGWWLYLPGSLLAAALIAYPSLLPPRVDLNSALRPINAVTLIGLGLGGGVVARALSTRVMVFLGQASYGMYILHIPILWWYLRWSHTFSPALYIGIVIAVSSVVYAVFEEPANRKLRGLARRL